MNIFIVILIFISFFVLLILTNRGNKAALIVSIVLTILIVIFHKHIRLPFFGSLGTINSITKSEHTLPFISSKWQDSILVHSDPTIRIGMIDDFISHHNLHQINKEEILSLLGKPDKNDELKEWDLVYWLGEEQLFIGSYTQWFAIEFDSSSMVSEYSKFRY